jgi:hypothetical protein
VKLRRTWDMLRAVREPGNWPSGLVAVRREGQGGRTAQGPGGEWGPRSQAKASLTYKHPTGLSTPPVSPRHDLNLKREPYGNFPSKNNVLDTRNVRCYFDWNNLSTLYSSPTYRELASPSEPLRLFLSTCDSCWGRAERAPA